MKKKRKESAAALQRKAGVAASFKGLLTAKCDRVTSAEHLSERKQIYNHRL